MVTGVKKTLEQSGSTFTLGMKSANESDALGWRKYDNTSTAYASFPKLTVKYFGPTTVPTGLAITQGDGSALVGGTYVTATSAIGKATVAKPEGRSVVAALYSVTNSAGVETIVVGSKVTAASGVSTAPALNLPADGDYKVKVKACAVEGSGTSWSACSGYTAVKVITRDRTTPVAPVLTGVDSVQTTKAWSLSVKVASATSFTWSISNSQGSGTVTTSSTGTVSKTFAAPGRYVVSVTAKDDAGNVSPAATFAVKVWGVDAAQSTHRYVMNSTADSPGAGASAMPMDQGNASAADFALQSTKDGCSPGTNKVYSPRGVVGSRMRTASPGLGTDSPFAMSALVKPSKADVDVVASGAVGTSKVYVWGVSSASVSTTYITIRKEADGPRWVAHVDGTVLVGPLVTVPDPAVCVPEVWYAVGLTKDATGAAWLFVDGAAVQQSSGVTTNWVETSWIGVGAVGPNSNSFTGAVDELTFWDGPMTATKFNAWYPSVKSC